MADATRRSIILGGSALAMSLVIPVKAGATVGGFGGSTEFTQLANLAQLADQSVRQVTQVANQARQITQQIEQIQVATRSYITQFQNTLSLPDQVWSDFERQARELRDAVENGGRLVFSAGSIDEALREVFGGFDEYRSDPLNVEEYGEKYALMNRELRLSQESAARAASVEAQTFDSDQALVQMFRTNNARPEISRNALLQTANQVATENFSLMSRFKDVMAAQLNAMNNYFAYSADVDAARKAQELDYYSDSGAVVGNDKGY